MINVKNRCIYSEGTNLAKGKDDDYYMTARILPFGQVSRNNVMYDVESVKNTYMNLIGKPVLYNHNKDDPTPPRGEWVTVECKEDGLYGKAKIYNTTYNQDLIEYLSRSTAATVSLEIVGKADKRVDEETGRQYNLAFVRDWLESSVVAVPGFQEAKVLSFEYYIAESLGLGIRKSDGGNIMEKELIEKVEVLSEQVEAQTKLLEKLVEGFEVQSESFKKLSVLKEAKSEDEAEDSKEDEKEDDKKTSKKGKKKEDEEEKKESEDEVKAESVEEEAKEAEPEAEEAKEEEAVEEPAKEEAVEEPAKEEAVEEPAKEEAESEAVEEPAKEEAEVDAPQAPEVAQKESVKFEGKSGALKNKQEGEVWNEMLKRHFVKDWILGGINND